MSEKYTAEEVMDMHITFANTVMSMIDNTKRFVNYPDTQEVATEKKKLFRWKEIRRQSYEDVFLEDFNTHRKEVLT